MNQFKLNDFQIHHVFNKSISGFNIFNNQNEIERFLLITLYYNNTESKSKFSYFSENNKKIPNIKEYIYTQYKTQNRILEIIAYCIMPTHFHFIFAFEDKDSLSKFMSNLLNSYSRYFNLLKNRKGPLWEGHYKTVAVETDEQLLHLTRYIHLNPVTNYLVNTPEEWEFSSYKEFLNEEENYFCNYNSIMEIKKTEYKQFVEDSIDYQRQLAKIKKITLE